MAIHARFWLCAYKFCLKSSDCKGLKPLSHCMHANCILLALSDHVRSEIHKTFNFLLSEHVILYTEVDYSLLLTYEFIRNVKEFVCDTQIILIHV